MTTFWTAIARLGEAQILLPAWLAALAWLARAAAPPRSTWWWLAPLALAALATTATKVAFIGWGAGYAPLDFTGVSGHAMFAAAVLPLVAASVAPAPHRPPAVAAAYGLAALIALSRWITGHHSVAEVLLGAALGSAVSAVALAVGALPATRAPPALLLVFALWFVATPAGAPPSRTHHWVTTLALALSGHAEPYTRERMHRDWRARQRAASAATTSLQSRSITSTPRRSSKLDSYQPPRAGSSGGVAGHGLGASSLGVPKGERRGAIH